jgi:pimeloyl-ACP methyl ester carboxylesterase
MRQVLHAQGDAMLFHTDFAACNAYTHGLDAAARVRCPASLVIAQQDQMTHPSGTRDIAAALEATVHSVPAGHFLMQECPDGVLRALRSALDI